MRCVSKIWGLNFFCFIQIKAASKKVVFVFFKLDYGIMQVNLKQINITSCSEAKLQYVTFYKTRRNTCFCLKSRNEGVLIPLC